MKLLNNQYVLYAEKRVIAKIDGVYNEQKIKREIDELVGDEAIVENLPSKKYGGLMPMSIYLFPTSECNLRCRYCYSDAGERCHVHLTKQQIETVLQEAAKTAFLVTKTSDMKGLEPSTLEIWFGGGGEPTFEWDLFEFAVEKVKEYADKYGFLYALGILTNGHGYTKEKIDYLVKNFTFVQISFDGTREIQNIHRPSNINLDSFEETYAFVKAIMDKGVRFGIRGTVSKLSVEKLEEITEFFIQSYPKAEYISFDPLSSTDRSTRNDFVAPSVNDFVLHFENAMRIGKKHHIDVLTSLLDISQVRDGNSFCGSSSGDTCVVQPNGYLTSCAETMPLEMNTTFDPFIIGKVTAKGEMEKVDVTDYERINRLEEKCKDCDYLSFCQGDCPVIRYSDQAGHAYRCGIKKKLITDFLISMVEEKKEFIMNYKVIDCESSTLKKVCVWGDDVMKNEANK